MRILESIADQWNKHHELWGNSDHGYPTVYIMADGAMVCTPCAEARCERGDIPVSGEDVVDDGDGCRADCDDCGDNIDLSARENERRYRA